MSSADEVHQLLGRAAGVEDREKIGLIEQATRLADALNDRDLGMTARSAMLDAATRSGLPQYQIVAFQWMLARIDADPSLKPQWEPHLLFRYKWVADDLAQFLAVSRAKIAEVLEDMRRRYEAAGMSLRPFFQQWCANSRMLGDVDKAREYFAKWQQAPRDLLSDCMACETGQRVTLELEVGNVDEAVRLAEPLLAGKLRCGSQPQSTQGRMTVPLLQAGRVADAVKAQKQSEQTVFSSLLHMEKMGSHFAFFGVTSQWTKGIRLFQERFPWTDRARYQYDLLQFYLGTAVFFARMAHDRSSVKLNLPTDSPLYRSDARYDPHSIAMELNDKADRLARRFDERNENTFVSGFAERWRAMTEMPAVDIKASGA